MMTEAVNRVKNNRLLGELMNLLRLVLETDDITEALNGALEMIVSVLKCEEGAIWLLAKDTNLLMPLCHIGPVSFTNITVENGLGVEGTVTRSGKTILIRSEETG